MRPVVHRVGHCVEQLHEIESAVVAKTLPLPYDVSLLVSGQIVQVLAPRNRAFLVPASLPVYHLGPVRIKPIVGPLRPVSKVGFWIDLLVVARPLVHLPCDLLPSNPLAPSNHGDPPPPHIVGSHFRSSAQVRDSR
jgi:hypothetical protein